MRVNEVFASIQGEGIHTGARTTFVRFDGCSVKCKWCDTKYAWGEGDVTSKYVPAELIPASTLAVRVGGMQPRVACLTGGEPLEQDQGALGKLITELDSYGIDCHIETSGTIPVTDDDIIFNMAFWTISPKLSNADPKISADPNVVAELMSNIAGGGMNDGQLKFVIGSENDMQDVRQYLIALCEEPEGELYCPWPVVLQPLASGRLDYEAYFSHMINIKNWANTWLDEFDTRVMPQLHYLLWKGKKGV